MRLSVRLTFSLAAGVALVSVGLAIYQADTVRRNLRRELDRRALVVAESLEKSVAPLVETDSVRTLEALLPQFQHHERLTAIVIYDTQGKLLAATPNFALTDVPPGRALSLARQPSGSNGEFLRLSGRPMHLVATPVMGIAGPAGTLAILHDAGYIDAQVMGLWRRALAGVAAQTLMIVCATLLILRWTLRNPLRRLEKWLGDLRRGAVSEVPELAGEAAFEPLKREARRLATTLTAARAAAEEEARLRDAGESLWTEERLRAFIQSRLQGSRLFVVSNREPYEHVRRGAEIQCSVPASGLVTALEPILRASDGTWIAQGTGNADRETVDRHDHVGVPPEHPQYTLRRVWVTAEEEKGFYFGFANEGLWPLCHIAHTRPVFRAQDWECYRAVNQRFADALLEEISGEEKPIVLVQDYHFALLPRMIKAMRPDARVAIFWHIPWPNPEAFGICPWQDELLDGLLGADLVGLSRAGTLQQFSGHRGSSAGIAHRSRALRGEPRRPVHIRAAVPHQRALHNKRFRRGPRRRIGLPGTRGASAQLRSGGFHDGYWGGPHRLYQGNPGALPRAGTAFRAVSGVRRAVHVCPDRRAQPDAYPPLSGPDRRSDRRKPNASITVSAPTDGSPSCCCRSTTATRRFSATTGPPTCAW